MKLNRELSQLHWLEDFHFSCAPTVLRRFCSPKTGRPRGVKRPLTELGVLPFSTSIFTSLFYFLFLLPLLLPKVKL